MTQTPKICSSLLQNKKISVPHLTVHWHIIKIVSSSVSHIFYVLCCVVFLSLCNTILISVILHIYRGGR